MKKFFKNQPKNSGRVKITVETDMVVVREWFQLIGDLPAAITARAHTIPEAIKAVVKALEDLPE